jgi:hypothetical protein
MLKIPSCLCGYPCDYTVACPFDKHRSKRTNYVMVYLYYYISNFRPKQASCS